MNKKNILTIVTIIVLLMVAFWYLGYNGQNTAGLSTDTQTSQSAEAKQIYVLLQEMAGVKLDNSLFDPNSSFEKLKDNTVSFSAQESGRNNPFAPIGSDTLLPTATSTVSTKILPTVKK